MLRSRAAVSPLVVVALAAILSLAPGCNDGGEDRHDGDGTVSRGPLTVRAHRDGTIDIERDGRMVFEHASADALVDDGAGRRLISTGACASPPVAELHAEDAAGPSLDVRCTAEGATLALHVELPARERHLTLRLDVVVDDPRGMTVLRTAPLVVRHELGGALWLGRDPATHRILENGRFIAFDQSARIESGDVAPFSLAPLLPIPVRGSSVSNWSHLVHDLASKTSIIAGALTTEAGVPAFGIGVDEDVDARVDGQGGRAFTTYAAESVLTFRGKRVPAGGHVASEAVYLDVLSGEDDPLEGMERYAEHLASFNHVVPWARRAGARPIPNGWNSWSGGGSTGGHGQAIDEALVLRSMDVFARELMPFGGNHFQIDDGWQDKKGDWQFKTDTFPSGGRALASRIAARGLAPGLWIAPFWAEPSSKTNLEHPDWRMGAEDSALSLAAKPDETLDPSSPAVLAMLREKFTALREDGWKWAKTDFTYYALLGRPHDPAVTSVEAWRQGMKAIREALGPDVFLLGIGAVGLEVGIADGVRLTLDNAPRWDEPADATPLAPGRAIRETVRTASRRWFYGNRAFVAHPDLVFFRSMDGAPPLSPSEARAFATFVGLTGGIVKIGDKLVDVEGHAEWIDVLRRLMPAHPVTARPVDLLLRDVPEQMRARISAPAGEWDVVGLFHWGRNMDLSASPPVEMADAPRSLDVTCDGPCLAYELWSEAFLGEKSGTFSVPMEPHSAKVLSLRKPTGVPQVLGTNRHVLMGANDLGRAEWNAASRTLHVEVIAAAGTARAPFEHLVALHVPAGFTLDRVTVTGVTAPRVQVEGALARVRFRVNDADHGKRLALDAVFR